MFTLLIANTQVPTKKIAEVWVLFLLEKSEVSLIMYNVAT